MKIAACNIVGPDGLPVYAGDTIPDEWPEEVLEDLKRGGAVVDGEVDEEAFQGPDEGDES